MSCYCIARFKKHHQVADYLEQKGALIDIHTAAFLGDFEGVREFLRRNRKLLHSGHPQFTMESRPGEQTYVVAPASWATPLCYALRGGDLETVQYLISRGAKVKGNESALFIAANDSFDLIKLLLENGADPTKLHSTAAGNEKLDQSLGVKPPSRTMVNEELVYLCRGDRGGNVDELRRLIGLGGNVRYRDKKGKTALHRATRSGFTETIAVLLEHDAPLEIEDDLGETPLFEAVRTTIKNQENRGEALRLLLAAGADLGHTNHQGQTPAEVAKTLKTPPPPKILKQLKPARKRR